MIHTYSNYIGLTYTEFSKQIKQELEKHFYPSPNETCFSIFLDGNEYMFIDDRISTIEINNIKKERKNNSDFKVFKKLEKNLSYLSKKEIPWSIFDKYSKGMFLTIKVQDFVYYEYEFEDSSFKLYKIRADASKSNDFP